MLWLFERTEYTLVNETPMSTESLENLTAIFRSDIVVLQYLWDLPSQKLDLMSLPPGVYKVDTNPVIILIGRAHFLSRL